MEACHRIGKKNVVIARFVNRKFARQILYNQKNLKNTKLYGENSKVYVNDSFCRPFSYIGFVIRKLKKKLMIEGYKVRNGIFSVKLGAHDKDFIDITHKNDFVNLNLDIDSAVAE